MPKYSQYNVSTVDECVNFGVGQPDTRKLPIEFLKNAFTKYGNELNDPEVLQYGQISGYHDFKTSLADWLNKKNYSSSKVNANELFITNGNTGALNILMNQYLETGDIILVEEPSYFLAINIFKEFGLNIDYIPMEKDGLNLEILEEKVRKYSEKQKSIFLYTVPTCHNPTGYTLSDIKRKQMSSLATVYNNFYVIADEVYHFLRWDNSERIEPMADYHTNFISLGSFSKILAPSLRVGWIYINDKFLEKYDETNVIQDISNNALFDSSGGINVLGSMIVHQAITSGFLDEYLDFSLNYLKDRCETMIECLKNQDEFTFEKPLGGYFLWLKSKNNTKDVFKTVSSYKIKYHYGSKFSCLDKMDDYLRLSFSYYDSKDIKVGIERLVKCFSDYSKVKLSILGFNGKLGSAIVNLIKNDYSDKYKIVSKIGRDIENYIEQIKESDVIIDVSSTVGTMNLLNVLMKYNVYKPVISGTTGHVIENIKVMKDYGMKCPIMNINNFSKGIAMVKNIINLINNLDDSWSVKIIETHHIHKKDSPSGTAKVLQSLINKNCIIESIREGENFGNHRIIISNDFESIEINHQALNRNLFAKGCIDTISEILTLKKDFITDLDFKISESLEKTYSASGNIIHIVENYKYDKKEYTCELANDDDKLDGVVFIENLDILNKTIDWQYYNRDGNRVDFCGNGMRSLITFVKENYNIDTLKVNYYDDGKLTDSTFTLKYCDDMAIIESPEHVEDKFSLFNHQIQSNLESECENLGIEVIDIELHNVGVPHLIIEIKLDVFSSKDILEVCGSILSEYWIKNISSDGININFININSNDDNHSISVVTWERGVNRITLSCGSGSIACYYYYLNDGTIKEHQDNIKINNLGNFELYVYDDNDNVYLKGPVYEYNKNYFDYSQNILT